MDRITASDTKLGTSFFKDLPAARALFNEILSAARTKVDFVPQGHLVELARIPRDRRFSFFQLYCISFAKRIRANGVEALHGRPVQERRHFCNLSNWNVQYTSNFRNDLQVGRTLTILHSRDSCLGETR